MALDTNLVAYYKLDWNSNDSVGSNNWTDTSVSYVAGKIGNAAQWNWTSSKIIVANNLWVTWWNISIAWWFKMNTDISSGFQCFCEQSDNGTSVWNSIRYDYNSWTRRLVFDRVRYWIVDEQVLYNITLWTTWHHIAYTYNWTTVTWYVDWASVWTIAASWNWSVPQWNFFSILALNWGFFSNITIDEIWIWSRAISWSEITQLYNAWAWLTYPFTTQASNPAFLLNFF